MLTYRKPSNSFRLSNGNGANEMNAIPAVTPSPVVANGENAMIDQTAVKATIQAIFDDRRVWEKNEWTIRVTATKEEIETWSAEGVFMKAFDEKRIRVTQDTNGTRSNGIAALFSNNIQDDQLGRALLLWDTVPYYAEYQVKSDGYREIAMVDTEGDHDIIVVEELDRTTGFINYSAYYATKAYNNHGQLIGLKKGSINKVQEGIAKKVESYNVWVDAHNAAAKAVANGVATDEQVKLMAKAQFTDLSDPNMYVIMNTVRHIAYGSVINHWALLAMLLLDDQRPAFELFTFARTAESFQTWLQGRNSGLNWGYQAQAKKLAGIKWEQPVK